MYLSANSVTEFIMKSHETMSLLRDCDDVTLLFGETSDISN